jgi:hypothetical protein
MGIAQAGVLFFRPCAGVARHMMQLAQASRPLSSTMDTCCMLWYTGHLTAGSHRRSQWC